LQFGLNPIVLAPRAEVALLDRLRRADGLTRADWLGRGLGFALRALHSEKVGRIVRADELDLARGSASELAQPLLIGAALRAVELHQRLEKTHALGRGAESSARRTATPQCPRECPGNGTSSTSSRVPGTARMAEKPNQVSPSSSTAAHFLTEAICAAR
jgi:hypothetical protein